MGAYLANAGPGPWLLLYSRSEDIQNSLGLIFFKEFRLRYLFVFVVGGGDDNIFVKAQVGPPRAPPQNILAQDGVPSSMFSLITYLG